MGMRLKELEREADFLKSRLENLHKEIENVKNPSKIKPGQVWELEGSSYLIVGHLELGIGAVLLKGKYELNIGSIYGCMFKQEESRFTKAEVPEWFHKGMKLRANSLQEYFSGVEDEKR